MSLRGFFQAQAGRWVDPSLRAKFWRLLEEPARLSFRTRLRSARLSAPTGAPVLNYGGALVGQGMVHGGRVKLIHLAERFPEAAGDFNLLYLVSSAPPRFGLELVEWARGNGVKFVLNQNGVAYPAWCGDRGEEINGPMRALRQEADFIFHQSVFCKFCADQFLGEVNAPGEIAFNCVDTALFRPDRPPSGDACQLLVAGSHHESYRVLSALETVAELRRRRFPVRLRLAGRLAWPNAEAEVREKIQALRIGDNVEIAAPYSQSEAPGIYRAAHILIHAKYKDPCPTVPIEAMACGVAVMGSRSGGMPELVSEAAGVLIEVPESWAENHWPTPRALADGVETIMSRWPQFSADARAHAVARFSKTQWVAQHARVFNSLLKR